MINTINVNYFTKEELQYELSLRNVTVPSHMGVELLRKLLRELINSVADVKFLSGKIDSDKKLRTFWVEPLPNFNFAMANFPVSKAGEAEREMQKWIDARRSLRAKLREIEELKAQLTAL